MPQLGTMMPHKEREESIPSIVGDTVRPPLRAPLDARHRERLP